MCRHGVDGSCEIVTESRQGFALGVHDRTEISRLGRSLVMGALVMECFTASRETPVDVENAASVGYGVKTVDTDLDLYIGCLPLPPWIGNEVVSRLHARQVFDDDTGEIFAERFRPSLEFIEFELVAALGDDDLWSVEVGGQLDWPHANDERGPGGRFPAGGREWLQLIEIGRLARTKATTYGDDEEWECERVDKTAGVHWMNSVPRDFYLPTIKAFGWR